MKHGKTAALTIAALVLGLVVGGVVTGGAAPAADTTTTTTATAPAGLGLRLGAAMRDAGGRLADVVAKLTGQEADAVIEQRQAGTSFSAIAEKYDVEATTVVSEALKVRKSVLDEKVKAGTITQDQADAAIDRMTDRITDRVESTDAGCTGTGGGGMGGGGKGRGARDGSGMGGGGRGMGGGACAQTTTATQ